jgi:hypothetical protein
MPCQLLAAVSLFSKLTFRSSPIRPMTVAIIKTGTEKTCLTARTTSGRADACPAERPGWTLCALTMPRLASAARSSWSCAVCHTRHAGARADLSCVYGVLAAVPRSSMACNRAHERKTARWERRRSSTLGQASMAASWQGLRVTHSHSRSAD